MKAVVKCSAEASRRAAWPTSRHLTDILRVRALVVTPQETDVDSALFNLSIRAETDREVQAASAPSVRGGPTGWRERPSPTAGTARNLPGGSIRPGCVSSYGYTL